MVCCASGPPEMAFCTGQCGPDAIDIASATGIVCHTPADCPAGHTSCHASATLSGGGTVMLCY
jgi:hypothetical protein